MTHFENLKTFIENSPTSLFCAETIEKELLEAGFKSFNFDPKHSIPHGEKIYLKNKGMIAAVVLPTKLKAARYMLAHTDSPCLKLKPEPIISMSGMNFFTCEAYGAPLLSSYMGKPLKLAGHVAVMGNGGIEIKKVSLKGPFVIPEPAIHLSKEANAALDKGKLHALISYGDTPKLNELLGIKETILSHDLYLVFKESLTEFGLKQKLFGGPRLDNLSSCYALKETLKKTEPQKDTLLVGLFFDHEEVGSDTLQGAKSHFFKKRLKKIIESYSLDSMLDIHSQALSLDVGHADHPSYGEKFDPHHPVTLGGGVLIKHQPQQKYAQDLYLMAKAKTLGAKTQVFTMRNEVGTGSTLGPYFASLFSIPTQDIGLPLLAMHSTFEIIAESDLENLIQLGTRFFHG